MNKDIKVSVVCLTYNHEKYIEDALKGFVMQETNFDYEVIVHDDASTDNTKLVIEKYASRYDFIKPIYEEENQYSKGINVSSIVMPHAKGKYICYCEGDDYWIDPHKLQKQYDFMEMNPNCNVVGHSYIRKNMQNKTDEIIHTENLNGIISIDTIIENKNPLHISTQMFRSVKKEAIPSFFFSIKNVGDYPILLYHATQGEICYIEDTMSVYRFRVDNSWTNIISDHPANVIPCLNNIYNFLKQFDDYTKNKYHITVTTRLQEITDSIEYNLSILKNAYEKNKENDEIINKLKSSNENLQSTIENHKEIISNSSSIIDKSILDLYKLIECRPYKIANIIHNYSSKIHKNVNLLKEDIDKINNSLSEIKNKI